MNPEDLSYWWITDPHSGQRIMSEGPLTEAAARAVDRSAQRVYSTAQQRSGSAASAAQPHLASRPGVRLDTSM